MEGTSSPNQELLEEISALKLHVRNLQRSELDSGQRLRNVTNNLSNAVVYQITGLPDGSRRFTYVSRSVERLNEVTVEEVMADAGVIYRQVLPEYRAIVAEREEEALKNLTTLRAEVLSRLPSGRFRWFEYTSTPRRQADGLLVWDGVEVDITARKRAEEALQESENRFRRLAENAPDLVYRMSLPDGKYEYVSPSSLQITGFTPEEHYSGTGSARKTVHPDFAGYFEEQWESLLKGEMPSTYEYKIIHKNGGERWLHQRNVLIRDKNGSPVAIEGIVTDITDRKKMEEELTMHRDHLGTLVAERTAQIRQEVTRRKEKEEQYLALVESIRGWVWEVDTDLVYTYASSGMQDILGYSLEEFTGKNSTDFMAAGEIERLGPLIRETISQRKPFISVHHTAIHKKGHLVFVEVNGVPFFDQKGKLLGYRGSCHDVTEQKRTMDVLKEREEELTVKSKTLEEVNAALRVLLKQREEDREDLEQQFVSNIREMILPYILKAKKGQPDPTHKTYLEIAVTNLNEIISPFLNTMRQLNFTPREIEVASLVKDGRTTKEIAELMGVAPSAIDSHRNNIRIKVGLNKKKINLRSYLLALK